MALATANLVAERIISLSHERHNPATNLKLQKLLYYAQAWSLAIHKKPLFPEDFEAWVHGPVVPEVFRRYRSLKWSPIPDPKPAGPYTHKPFLEEVWKVYGNFSAYDLERLTHSEQPWRDARTGLAPDESSSKIISKLSMRDYYSKILNEQKTRT